MKIIPAIDIIEGDVVRLSKGEFNSVVKYEKSPLEQGKIYDDHGFEWLHMVDLSGSKEGKIYTRKIIEDIKSSTNLRLEFGGGVRSEETVKELIGIGVDGVIIGSLSITDKNEFESIMSKIDPSKIIIAADVLNYFIQIKGWTENSQVHLFEHIKYCCDLGVSNFLCTDISVDGMLTGPNKDLYEETLSEFPTIQLTASGGISNLNDIMELRKLSLRGVVVGKAIYENKINLKDLSKIAL
ncbi:MAG: 1-(5-phosphoribosyl)-5-[(5-phosphoribosylamino)methylideneamino]imidazole-4-carboxamide isomerase [Melioribacteraceae bacterium]|nr:1-(5-phosphoribosyl)-5-[(5-phosphoribosylamino)methylideneamino]imidazole-4-carboxamide isomerase [Melioribacteraceae bacterium]